jgi:hypothetical protein
MNLSNRLATAIVLAISVGATACAAPVDATDDTQESANDLRKAGVKLGGRCGGFAGIQCQVGLSCENIPGKAPIIADGFGKCVNAGQPEGGRCGGLRGIQCQAGLACENVPGEAPIAADGLGKCTKVTKIGTLCGTRGARECTGNQFCEFAVGTECGATDKGGSCQELPRFCLANFAPVTGCDGETYSNACGANAAGVSVKIPFGSK